jgi:CubicO group peptidase (beta-lactamase class C family)
VHGLRGRRVAIAFHAGAAALLFVLTGCATRSDSPAGGLSAGDAQAVDRLLAPYRRPGAPGAAVAIIQHGRPLFMRGYGLAELESRARVTERTNFRLASLTKPFTATAVMLLVNEGRLTLDHRVRDVLPDFPEYGREIRIRHLLTHTSGLRAYEDFVPESSTRHVRDRDVVALLRRTDRLLFAPGTAFRYGDTGYALLALVVETVSGQPFARFLHERIFAPLGMTSTVVWEPGVSVVPNRAFGYAPTRRGGFGLADHTNTSTVLGDGGIYSSVRDLAVWDRALNDRRLLDARTQELAWTPAALNDGTKTRYGLGWFVERGAGGRYVFHRGESSGFNNYLLKYPERGLTVIVLTNRRGGAPDDIATTLATLPAVRASLR